MVDWKVIKRLLKAFPGSFINDNLEFIAEKLTNQYLCLEKCESEFEIKCKMLEWFSRAAFKTQYYRSERSNDRLHRFMLDGINTFLNAAFSEADMEVIYEKLGNCIDHELTESFVKNGYDMDLLTMREDGSCA